MFLFKKNDNIGKYVVVFPHKEGSYAQTRMGKLSRLS